MRRPTLLLIGGTHGAGKSTLERRDERRWARVEHPPDIVVPLLRVDTTDGYEPGLDAIVEFTRSLRDPP